MAACVATSAGGGHHEEPAHLEMIERGIWVELEMLD